MRKLPLPMDSAIDTFRLCVSQVKDKAMAAKFSSIESNINAAESQYSHVGSRSDFIFIPQHTHVGGKVSKDEMVSLYDLRMARKSGKARPVYDRIKNAPPYGRCPLCAQGTVSSIDHYLPKTLFPALAVTPANLIPACASCNKSKGDDVPEDASEQILHPYFDDVNEEVWLKAAVVGGKPAAVRFFVDPPVTWSELLRKRIQHHFNFFSLATLYASYAGEEISCIRHSLIEIRMGGSSVIATHLSRQARSHSSRQKNSWQAAMYEALAGSAWYCGGGFE